MPDLVTISTAPAPLPGPPDSAEPRPQPLTSNAAAITANDSARIAYSFAYRLGRNHAGSLLLAPLVVNWANSLSAAVFKSRTPARSADTAKIFQSLAYAPTISAAAWNVPGLLASPRRFGPRLKVSSFPSGDQSTG